MNHADRAKQLQQERLKKERLASEKEAKANEETAEKERQLAELGKQKTEELSPLFKQFTGFKICNGQVTVEADVKYPTWNRALMCLKAGSVGLSALTQYPIGTLLLSAHYDAQSATYQLNRYEVRPRIAGSTIIVGNYKTTDELLNAVTEEISKL
jgi:hypothetical protein